MFGIGYFKGQPTEYGLKYAGGRVTAEGVGLAFFDTRYNTQVVAVPAASGDAPFVFHETTADFQTVTVQGQLTYRIVDPKRLTERLNFGVEADARAEATAAQLAAYRDLDPRAVLASGLKKLGDDAKKIGQRTVTPDLLASVLGDRKS